jgi:MFS family permease
MLATLRQRNFALLWWAGLISVTGDWALIVALPIYVYKLTGSTLLTGAMFVAGFLPNLLIGSLAGVFVDRWERKRIMVSANIAQACGVLPLLVVHSPDRLWVVYLVFFGEATLAQFFTPAAKATLPLLVDRERLLEANALTALNDNLARLVGPPLGGVVAGVLGLRGVVLVDAGSFAISGVMIAAIAMETNARGPVGRTAVPPSTAERVVWGEWVAGLRLITHSRVVTVLVAILVIPQFGEGIFNVLFVVFVARVLHGGVVEIGWLMGAQAVGGLIGSLLIGAIGRRIAPRRLVGWGALGFGLVLLAIFNTPHLTPAFAVSVILFALVAVPGAGYIAGVDTLLQTAVPDQYRGRVVGTSSTTSGLLRLCGMGCAAVLGGLLGPVLVLNVDAIAYVTAGIVALAARAL